VNIRDRHLERIQRVAVLLVERPAYRLVQLLHRSLRLLRHVAHDGGDHLALVVPFLALDHIFGRDTSLGQINVALLFVHAQNDNDFVATHADELLDRTNTSPGQLGKQDHAIDVVVFEELNVGAHFGDLLDIHLR
jgi:hypothetical protein